MTKRTKLKGLAPIADERSRILILGSFPGPMSLERREYYAYPRNQFWKIVFGVLGIGVPSIYREKIEALKRKRIALWDAIESCRRENASDGLILDPGFNDIASLVKRCPRIRAIYCNGNKSFSVCKARHENIGVPITYLPSTSPAHAGISCARKKQRWNKILKYLKSVDDKSDRARKPAARIR